MTSLAVTESLNKLSNRDEAPYEAICEHNRLTLNQLFEFEPH